MSDQQVPESLLALALGTVSEGSLITDAAQNTIYVNLAFTEITGYSQAEIIGRNCRILQGFDTSITELQKLRDALGAGHPYQGTLLNYRKDGTPFFNELALAPVSQIDFQATGGTAALPAVGGKTVGANLTVDYCVQATTAFRNVADMMDTQPSYAPKFCLSQAITDAERLAMLRAARAFNFHAEQAGQARRAFIF